MKRIALALCLMATAATAWSDEAPLTYDRISLNASAEAPVENDILVAVLFAQAEGPTAAQLADDVNTRIAQALDQAKAEAEVKAQTLDYLTTPVYRNNRVDGWRVSQDIRLESPDAGALSDLVGRLQQQLSIRSVGYEVSPARWAEAEDALIGEAIANFSERARRVAEAFGRKNYRIVDAHISTGGPTPVMMHGRAMAMDAAPAPPSFDAGTQDVRVQVNGTIELQ